MDIFKISNYLIARSDNAGDFITNKKLQKLLYYIKAWGLVYFPPKGIISEPFEAWVHGPVCRAVYSAYKHFGYTPLTVDYHGLSSSEYIRNFRNSIPENDGEYSMIELIDAVFEEYGQRTSLQLELLSHSEEPWLEAREGLAPNETGSNEISEATMKSYYAAKLKNQA